MATEGIEGVFVETHNWGRAARFFRALGFEVDESAGDTSRVLRNGDGPYIVLAEVPADRKPETHAILTVADADAFRPDPVVEVATPFEEHHGIKLMTVRDPDGRTWSVQAPGAA
ncbi:MAG: VOC family protein [Mycobacteriales bacterium]